MGDIHPEGKVRAKGITELTTAMQCYM